MNDIERRLQRIEQAATQRSRGHIEAGRIDLKGFIAPCYYELDDDVQNGRYQYFNETDINPPAELGRLADASGDEQSTRIKTPAV